MVLLSLLLLTFSTPPPKKKGAARKSDLYPTQDIPMLACDELLEAMNELIGKLPTSPDKDMLKKMRQGFAMEVMPRYFALFQSRMEQFGGPYLLGSKLSIADLFLYVILTILMVKHVWDYIPEDWVEENAPNFVHYYRLLCDHPIVIAQVAQTS